MGTITADFNPVPGQIYDLFCAVSGCYKTGNFDVYREMLRLRQDRTVQNALAPVAQALRRAPAGFELFFNYYRGRDCCLSSLYLPELPWFDTPESFLDEFASCDTVQLRARVLSYYDGARKRPDEYEELVGDPARRAAYLENMKGIHLLRLSLSRFLQDPEPIRAQAAGLLRETLPCVRRLHRRRRAAVEKFGRRKLAEFTAGFQTDGRSRAGTDGKTRESCGASSCENPSCGDPSCGESRRVRIPPQVNRLTLSVPVVNPYLCYVSLRGGRTFVCLGLDYEKAVGRDCCESDDIDLCRTARALSDEQRFSLLELLDRRTMYLSELADQLRMPPPAVFYHLNLLQSAGLITAKTSGRRVYYSVNRKHIRYLSRLFTAMFGRD